MEESDVVDSLADKISAEDLAEASAAAGALPDEFPVVCSAASSASGRPL